MRKSSLIHYTTWSLSFSLLLCSLAKLPVTQTNCIKPFYGWFKIITPSIYGLSFILKLTSNIFFPFGIRNANAFANPKSCSSSLFKGDQRKRYAYTNFVFPLVMFTILLNTHTAHAASAADIRLLVEPLFEKCLQASGLKRTNLQQAEIILQQEQAELMALTQQYPLALLQQYAGSLLDRCDSISQSIQRSKASHFVESALQACDSAKTLMRNETLKSDDLETLQTFHKQFVADLKKAKAIHKPVLESAAYKGQLALCEEVSDRVLAYSSGDKGPQNESQVLTYSTEHSVIEDQVKEIEHQLDFACEKLKQVAERGDRKESDALMIRMSTQMDTLLGVEKSFKDRASLSNNINQYQFCIAEAENRIRAFEWEQQQRQERKRKLGEALLGTVEQQDRFISQCTVKTLSLKEFRDIEWFLKEPDKLRFNIKDTVLKKMVHRAKLYRNKEFPRLASTIEQNQKRVSECKTQYRQAWEKRYAWLLNQQEKALAESNAVEVPTATTAVSEAKPAEEAPDIQQQASLDKKSDEQEEVVPFREDRKDDLELSPKRPKLISRRDASELIPGGR